jgi:hypothetical protein
MEETVGYYSSVGIVKYVLCPEVSIDGTESGNTIPF